MKKALTFGDYNPVHDGHVLGFQACLKVVDRVDVYVGRKPKAHQLPREIRMQALDAALIASGIQDQAIQINPDSLVDIDPEDYDALMMGSDVANLLIHPSKFREFEKQYFGAFGHIIVVQREMSPLLQAGEEALRALGGLDVLNSVSTSAARTIRNLWKQNNNFERFLHPGVWEVIEPHVEVWYLD